MKKIVVSIIIIALLMLSSLSSALLGKQENRIISITSGQYGKGYRYNIQGWIYLHIDGAPYERGFQHGYLLSAEIIDMLNRWSNVIHNHRYLKLISPHLSESHYKKISQVWWNFCVLQCYKMYWNKIPEEYKSEMEGIADGVNSAGGKINGEDVTYKDILALNEMYEFLSKAERMILNGVHPFRTLLHQLKTVVPEISTLDESTFINDFKYQSPTHHCSGFIATGDATTNRQIVISDSMWCGPGSWWWTYYIACRWNVILDINPTDGHRIIMASSPGYIWSNHDFYQNDAGIVLIETTVPQGLFDNIGLPLSVRVRTALQYGESINDVIYNLTYRNDGSMNSVWLVGDTKTGEIARLEIGYRRYHIDRTFNGFYWSANNPINTGVRLEKLDLRELISKAITRILYDAPGFGYYSIFYKPEKRDIKFEELGNLYYGKIDVDIVKKIMSTSPIGDYSTDCKITDSSLVEHNGMWAFYGNDFGKIVNLTNIDKPNRTFQQIHPTGWVNIFGLPPNKNYTFAKYVYNNEKKLNILWRFDTGANRNDFYASTSVYNNTLYAGTSSQMIYALNTTDGSLKWKQTIGAKPTIPVAYNDLVFIGHSDGISAFDLDGNVRWNISTESVISGPVVDNDIMIFGDKSGQVYAYSVDNRTQQWHLNFSDEAYISSVDNNTIYIVSGKNCYAVNINDSDILWNFETDGPIKSSPVINDDIVYFGSWDTFIYALNASTGSLIWNYETGWGIDTIPTIIDNMVFVGSNDNNFYALDAYNGSLKWAFTCKAGIHSSPREYNEYIIFGSDDGKLYLLNSSTGKETEYFTPGFSIDNDVYNYITTPIFSSPTIDNGIIYLGANSSIYALDSTVD